MIASNGWCSAEGGHQGAPSAPVSPTQVGVVLSFIGSTKATLRRVLGEKGVILTVEAQARLDARPETFRDFFAEIDSPRPDNARTAATRSSGGPRHPQGQERALPTL